MANDNKTEKGNQAGDTKTTGREYVKRESGGQDVQQVPAKNPGHTSPNQDDLDHPEHRSDKPHPSDKRIGEKIKDTIDQ